MSKTINKGDIMNKPIRHGEVTLLPVTKVPAAKAENHKIYIVGHSETGHHHVLESTVDFEVISDEEKHGLYIRLFKPAKLNHKKTINRHRDVVVPAGTYKVTHKQEYDPFAKVTRAVWD